MMTAGAFRQIRASHRGPDIEFQAVSLASLYSQSPVAGINCAHIPSRPVQVKPQGVRRGAVQGILVRNGRGGLGPVGVLHPPSRHRQVRAPPHPETVQRVVGITVPVRKPPAGMKASLPQ